MSQLPYTCPSPVSVARAWDLLGGRCFWCHPHTLIPPGALLGLASGTPNTAEPRAAGLGMTQLGGSLLGSWLGAGAGGRGQG